MFNYNQQPYPPQYQRSYSVPNYTQQYQIPQQNTQQMTVQPQFETPIQDVRFATKTQAEAYMSFPNTRALLIDRENGVAYLKSADNMGQPATKYFRFEEISADGNPIRQEEQKAQVDMGDFIKKSDIENFGFVTREQYNSLLTRLDSMQKQIQSRNTGAKQ